MKDHMSIGKFVGIYPSEKDLTRWINEMWKPKGNYDMQLGAKGFVMIILFNLEDCNRIIYGGPYVFN